MPPLLFFSKLVPWMLPLMKVGLIGAFTAISYVNSLPTTAYDIYEPTTLLLYNNFLFGGKAGVQQELREVCFNALIENKTAVEPFLDTLPLSKKVIVVNIMEELSETHPIFHEKYFSKYYDNLGDTQLQYYHSRFKATNKEYILAVARSATLEKVSLVGFFVISSLIALYWT